MSFALTALQGYRGRLFFFQGLSPPAIDFRPYRASSQLPEHGDSLGTLTSLPAVQRPSLMYKRQFPVFPRIDVGTYV